MFNLSSFLGSIFSQDNKKKFIEFNKIVDEINKLENNFEKKIIMN